MMDHNHHEPRHHAEPEPTHRHNGMTAEQIGDAVDEIENLSIPGTPPVRLARAIQRDQVPRQVGRRKVTDVSVTDGRPMHGAMRSDDHIGRFEIELPISEIDHETVEGRRCECGGVDALYRYSASHHIAGSETVFCLDCEEQLYNERWG